MCIRDSHRHRPRAEPYFDPDGGDGGMMTLTSTQIGQLAAQFFLAGAGTLSFAVLFACPKRCLLYTS